METNEKETKHPKHVHENDSTRLDMIVIYCNDYHILSKKTIFSEATSHGFVSHTRIQPDSYNFTSAENGRVFTRDKVPTRA